MLPLFYFYATSLLCWRTKLLIERYKEIYTYVIALENRKPFYNLINIDNITTLCTNLAYMSYPAFRGRSQELETVGNQSTKFSNYSVVFKKVENSRNSSLSKFSTTIVNNQDSVLLVEIIPRILYKM